MHEVHDYHDSQNSDPNEYVYDDRNAPETEPREAYH